MWGKFVRPYPPLDHATRERWTTPDGDHVTVVRQHGTHADAPRLLLFHGLEGTAQSHYVEALFHAAAQRGWGADLLLFRSCDGVQNAQPRFYHSGETGDPAWFMSEVAARHPDAPLLAMGVSLGGNVLVKLLGEPMRELPRTLRAAVAVSVPFDLARGSRHIDRGFSRVYSRRFLRSLIAKALAKRTRYPDRFPSAEAIGGIRSLWEFDDRITGPLHGFRDALDYYTQASSLQYVHAARVPLLLVSAVDDPFLPPAVLDEVRARAAENPLVSVEFMSRGGHVGFVSGTTPWRTHPWLASRVPTFLEAFLPDGGRQGVALSSDVMRASA
jgi:uncharacterized protein